MGETQVLDLVIVTKSLGYSCQELTRVRVEFFASEVLNDFCYDLFGEPTINLTFTKFDVDGEDDLFNEAAATGRNKKWVTDQLKNVAREYIFSPTLGGDIFIDNSPEYQTFVRRQARLGLT